jgi:hypothetical protein
MSTITLDGVRYRVLPVPEQSGLVKTSGVWNASKTKIKPCNNTKVLVGHLRTREADGKVPFGKEVCPRYM